MKQLPKRLAAFMFAAGAISAGPALTVDARLHLAVDDARDGAQGRSERSEELPRCGIPSSNCGSEPCRANPGNAKGLLRWRAYGDRCSGQGMDRSKLQIRHEPACPSKSGWKGVERNPRHSAGFGARRWHGSRGWRKYIWSDWDIGHAEWTGG